MLKSLCNSIYRMKPRENLWIEQLKLCSTLVKDNIENINGNADKFLEKESEILKVINSSNLRQLKLHIEPSYAKMIILSRIQNGPYKSLNDVLLRNKIEFDILNQFYYSIINCKSKPRKYKKLFKITPDITLMKEFQIPKTILSIHVGPILLSWALITSNCTVLEWDCIPWYNENPANSPYDLIKLIGFVVSKLPKSDCYVVEDIYLRHITSKNMFNCQKQFTVALMACFKLMEIQRTDDSSEPINRIYVLQPRATAYFYNLVVGSETVSTKYVIKKFINNDTETSDGESSEIYINDEFKNKYFMADTIKQEEMGWSLLKAMMFIQLIKEE